MTQNDELFLIIVHQALIRECGSDSARRTVLDILHKALGLAEIARAHEIDGRQIALDAPTENHLALRE